MLGLATIAGCASESLKPGIDGGPPGTPATDGGAPDRPPADPAACGCQASGYTLTISWDCFCKQYNCASAPPASCMPGNSQLAHGCGYEMFSVSTIGGIEKWVYDSSGQLVGEQLGTDDGIFTCPTDPSLQGFRLQAGYLLDDCEAIQTTQYSVDAGTCLPTDAGLTF
jgi:hypothetical protein